jgi:hypothetical protein
MTCPLIERRTEIQGRVTDSLVTGNAVNGIGAFGREAALALMHYKIFNQVVLVPFGMKLRLTETEETD